MRHSSPYAAIVHDNRKAQRGGEAAILLAYIERRSPKPSKQEMRSKKPSQWQYRYSPRASTPQPKCKEREEEEGAECPNQSREWLRSTPRYSGCCGINATYDPSVCGSCGSALSPLFVALSSDFIPLLVSWQNCISLQSDIRAPLDGDGGVLLLQDNLPLPILGQRPSTFYKTNGQLKAASCSILSVKRSDSQQESFEIFFLFWDEECGYTYVNSGKQWRRNLHTLQSVGNATLMMSLQRCQKVYATEAELIDTPWQAAFKLRLGAKNPSKCSQLSPSESALLQAWIRG